MSMREIAIEAAMKGYRTGYRDGRADSPGTAHADTTAQLAELGERLTAAMAEINEHKTSINKWRNLVETKEARITHLERHRDSLQAELDVCAPIHGEGWVSAPANGTLMADGADPLVSNGQWRAMYRLTPAASDDAAGMGFEVRATFTPGTRTRLGTGSKYYLLLPFGPEDLNPQPPLPTKEDVATNGPQDNNP